MFFFFSRLFFPCVKNKPWSHLTSLISTNSRDSSFTIFRRGCLIDISAINDRENRLNIFYVIDISLYQKFLSRKFVIWCELFCWSCRSRALHSNDSADWTQINKLIIDAKTSENKKHKFLSRNFQLSVMFAFSRPYETTQNLRTLSGRSKEKPYLWVDCLYSNEHDQDDSCCDR